MTGSQWNQLPERYGKWNSVYRFHLRWSDKGVFRSMLRHTAAMRNTCPFMVLDGSHVKVHQDACHRGKSLEEQCFGRTKGGRNSKVHALTNGEGKLLDMMLIPGNKSEVTTAADLLGDVRDKVVLADKGYDSDPLRDAVDEAGGVALIPGRSNRKKPVFYVKEVGRRRHVVENYFARVKRYRRVSTRYDRRAATYISFVCLASLVDWIK